MKVKMKKRNKNLMFFCILLFVSCKVENPFYFDLTKQMICSCDKKLIYTISIKNDSIKSDGSNYEENILISWGNKVSLPPNQIKIDSIPKGYVIMRAGIVSERKVKLRKNSRYTLSKSGFGGIAYEIDVWTDSSGNIAKTSQPHCEE